MALLRIVKEIIRQIHTNSMKVYVIGDTILKRIDGLSQTRYREQKRVLFAIGKIRDVDIRLKRILMREGNILRLCCMSG